MKIKSNQMKINQRRNEKKESEQLNCERNVFDTHDKKNTELLLLSLQKWTLTCLRWSIDVIRLVTTLTV